MVVVALVLLVSSSGRPAAGAGGCVSDLGKLSSASPSLSGTGTIAADAQCTSSLRDPDDSVSVYCARRHTFALDAAATVTLVAGPSGSDAFMVLSDGSGTEVARAQGSSGRRSRSSAVLRYLLLPAGTYTVEASRPVGRVGPYSVSAQWAPADQCVEDLGKLGLARPSLSGSGIVAVDAGCTSSLRDPDSTATHYARRHTFTLDAAATVSLRVGPASSDAFMILTDSTGNEIGRARGHTGRRSRHSRPARLANLPLEAGTYTVESSRPRGSVGYYSVRVDRQPLWRHAVLTAASAAESDGTAVFTLAAAIPQLDGPVDDVSPVWMRWETVSGTAAPGLDFTGASGTVQIPADGSRATITVPLVDDTASETTESFAVRLSSPSGATLANTQATAWIHDDDLAAGAAAQPSAVSVCEDPKIAGSVGDVFDIAQPGYSASTDVFVDVELSCKSGAPAAGGYRTGAEIMTGPAGRRASSWCVRTDLSPLTRSLRANDSCAASGPATRASPAAATHVMRIPDSAVGEGHQMRVWVDLDGDGARDANEQSRLFPASFVKEPGADGTLRFGLAQDFTATVLPGSDMVGRAGQYVELRVAVEAPTGRYACDPAQRKPVAVTAPLADATLGAYVYTGPSGTAQVTCLPPAAEGLVSPGYSTHCATDHNGIVTLQYQVEPTAIDSGPQQDDLRVYWDRNANGKHQAAPNHPAREPSDTIPIPIAKAVNYVALGDSYSAGEAGEDPQPGEYLSGNPADERCRRWSLAYPQVIDERILRGDFDIDGGFATFACTGALTLNIYNDADPDGESTDVLIAESNRPSSAAPRLHFRRDINGDVIETVQPDGWEPRQTVSLAAQQHEFGHVDMVTLTIGGNDAGFGGGILVCALVAECDPAPSVERLAAVEDRIVDVLRQIKSAAPGAAIFVLGYPYVTPEVDPCANPEEIRRPGRPPTVEFSFEGLPEVCEALWNKFRPAVDDCISLSATGVVRGSLFFVIGALLQVVAGSDRTRIDYKEAKAMWAAADRLNETVREAAARAGAHFVDVVGGVPLGDAPRGFVGHSSCNSDDPWLNGFVAKEGFRLGISGADGSSFHPTDAGHRAYARILDAFIRSKIDSGAALNDAGLPLVSDASE